MLCAADKAAVPQLCATARLSTRRAASAKERKAACLCVAKEDVELALRCRQRRTHHATSIAFTSSTSSDSSRPDVAREREFYFILRNNSQVTKFMNHRSAFAVSCIRFGHRRTSNRTAGDMGKKRERPTKEAAGAGAAAAVDASAASSLSRRFFLLKSECVLRIAWCSSPVRAAFMLTTRICFDRTTDQTCGRRRT